MVFLIALILVTALGGCLSPRQTASDERRVREIVRDELRTGRTMAVLEQLTREAGVGPLVGEVLNSPDMQSTLSRMVQDLLGSPEVQQSLSGQLRQLLSAPEVQSALEDVVRRQLMQIIQAGGGQ